MDEISDPGFVVGPEFSGTANCFHNFREVVKTSHAVLTTALKDGRRWMLKSLPEDLRLDPMYLALQRKEYEILCRLNHPAVVSVYELVEIPALGPSIVMEYVDGDTLGKADLCQSERRKVAHSLAEAIRYIHSCQVVHRDLKPTNIIVTHNGRNVKIVDFGLADTDAHTILKQPAGTAGYMSHEQKTSNKPDVRNDIYSLGLILKELNLGWQYHWLINRMLRPIDSRTESMDKVLDQMNGARRIPVWSGIGGLAIVLLVVISLFIIPHGGGPTKADAGISTNVDSIRKGAAATTESTHDTVVVQPITQNAVNKTTTVKPMSANEASYDDILQDGKAKVDAFMQENHFAEMADTVTYHQETRAALNRIMGKAATLIAKYASEHTDDEPSRLAMKKQLDEYTVDKYWSPYYIRITKLQKN